MPYRKIYTISLNILKFQEACSILRIGFALTKRLYTKGLDEVIVKSLIWPKLYQMNTWNLSRKDKMVLFKKMSEENKISND